MLSLVKSFLKEEEGMGTVEIVLIIAVLVAIALLFKDKITEFVNKALGNIFDGLDSETTH
ncbi:MAG: hypothetical protein IJ300_10655 [Clostridia bacterium]|nr:hypothetical protein [Clostridia bacterium]